MDKKNPSRQRLALGASCAMLAACSSALSKPPPAEQIPLGHRTVPLVETGGLRFKDLNRNGALDAYEDWRLPAAQRARDLVNRMTLEEKAGTMMHGTLVTATGGTGSERVDLAAMTPLIADSKVTAYISRLQGGAGQLADEANRLQEIAESTRLGVPVTISSDPRHHFQYTLGASVAPGAFSQWPDPLGLAAIGDAAVVRRFGDIARQEYLAVGITQALSPQADLATEPRWPRVNGTFGEDAELARRLVQAQVEGLQDGAAGLGPRSVAAVVKHWSGYGAAKDGWDGHNPYGKFSSFAGGRFAYHLRPFDGAFAAGVASVMPSYSLPDTPQHVDGIAIEPVGAAYSRGMITGLLRGRMGFQGVTLADWGVTRDCVDECLRGAPAEMPPFAFWHKFGTPWGVEDLSPLDRYVRAVDAGIDQFGGVTEPRYLVQAVQAGRLPAARLDESVYRIVLQRFRQGLFENPYVDPRAAVDVVGQQAFRQAALDAQRRSLVLLQNRNAVLPLSASVKKVYLYGIDPAVAASYGLTVVDRPEAADVALLRVSAPFERLHPDYIFGSMQHEGSLAYADGHPDYEAIKTASAKVPSIVTVYLDRPAILTNVVDKAAAVLGNFGVGDVALFDVLTGRARPQGKLPLELPSSMDEVRQQQSDVPHDTAKPLFPFGFGL